MQADYALLRWILALCCDSDSAPRASAVRGLGPRTVSDAEPEEEDFHGVSQKDTGGLRVGGAAASSNDSLSRADPTADALRARLAGGMELQKLSTWGLAQRRVLTIEATEAGERLFWQKPGTTARRDAESCIKVFPSFPCSCVNVSVSL